MKFKMNELTWGLLFFVAAFLFLAIDKALDEAPFYLVAISLFASGAVYIIKFIYHKLPWNAAKYQLFLEDGEIEKNDELVQRLKDKAGRYSFNIGMVILVISVLAFSIYDAILPIDDARIFIAFLAFFVVGQTLLNVVIYDYFLSDYK